MIDKKTAQRYLAGLDREGWITLTRHGYLITEAGMQELLDGEILKNRGENLPIEVEVVEDIKLLDSSTSTTTEEGENLPDSMIAEGGENLSEKILAALPDLFGSELARSGLPDDLDAGKLLGWIAYAYSNRSRLYSPCGLIYTKLKERRSPPNSFWQEPGSYLPEAFMDAIGLWSSVCERCKKEFTSLAEYEAHRGKCIFTPIEEDQGERVAILPDETVTDDIKGIWDRILEGLKLEMPKASFETWLRDTFPVHYAGGRITVGTRNQYAKDWLEARMTEAIKRDYGQLVEWVVACKRR